MKLSGRDAARMLAAPDTARPGYLIYGNDAGRVDARRGDFVAALLGPGAAEEMRLARMSAAELRADPAAVQDAMRARGFFPGPRAVLVEGAGDGLSAVLGDALAAWQAGDATLVVTAGALAARSSLRKLFEAHASACALPVYDDPPGRDEIAAELARAGAGAVAPDALDALVAMGRGADPGEVRGTIEKLALLGLDADAPLTAEDVARVAPATPETGLDEVIDCAAEAREGALPGLLARLSAQGVNATTLCIAATRHFRRLHALASDRRGPEAAAAGLRPGVFGPRRDRLVRQARSLGQARLEEALALLLDTDLELRSGRPVPGMALTERALVRIAMMRRR